MSIWHLTLEARLSPDARTVRSPSFKIAFLETQHRRDDDLTTSEKRAVKRLPLNDLPQVETTNSSSGSMVERMLKRLKITKAENRSNYIKTRFFVPTSKLCGKINLDFSQALTNRRREILPVSFKSQICLRTNDRWWDIEDVKAIVWAIKNSAEDTCALLTDNAGVFWIILPSCELFLRGIYFLTINVTEIIFIPGLSALFISVKKFENYVFIAKTVWGNYSEKMKNRI